MPTRDRKRFRRGCGSSWPDRLAAHDQAVNSQQRNMLWRCIAGLTEVERTVVYGQYYEETTLRELTETLRLTNRSGARAELIKAQRKLRRCLEKAAGQTGGRP